MSKIFWDNFIDLTKVEKKIKKIVKNPDEREEIYALIDEIVHHRCLGCILDNLPQSEHKNFISEFSKRPHDESLFDYLREKVEVDFKEFIKMEMHALMDEILLIVHNKTSPKKALS